MHKHTVTCYASNDTGPLAYTPCRTDGLDRNLRNMKDVDYEAMQRCNPYACVTGLTLTCKQNPIMYYITYTWEGGTYEHRNTQNGEVKLFESEERANRYRLDLSTYGDPTLNYRVRRTDTWRKE